MNNCIIQSTKFFGIIVLSILYNNNIQAQKNPCFCDTIQTKEKVTSKNFTILPQFDKKGFTKKNFEKLDQGNKKILWYRELESTDSTKFTRFWDDYNELSLRNNTPSSFLQYYSNRKDIELAIEYAVDLWGGQWYFVFKKIGCCYLITKNYYNRTAKFAHKSYAIVQQPIMDDIHKLISQMKIAPSPLSKYEELDKNEGKPYHISCILNNKTNKQIIAARFENETVKTIEENENLYRYFDTQIHFTVSMQF